MTTLADVMTDEVFYLTTSDTATRAAQAMRELNVGIIPICDDERRLLAVVTDRDLVLRVLAEDRGGDTQLGEIATQDPIAGQKEWDVSSAIEIMSEEQIRRLPVVEDGKLVGIVSLGDISVQASQEGAGAALEEISKPAMPRKGKVDQGDYNRA